MKYFVGVDLGKKHDYTAISVTERKIIYPEEAKLQDDLYPEKVLYLTRYLYRPPLDTSYHDIVQFMVNFLNSHVLKGQSALVIDATGVGEAVAEMFVEEGLNPVLIKLTSGLEYRTTETGFNVPKLDIIAVLQILLQNGLYKVSKKLRLADHFLKELQNFKYEMTAKGNLTMEAARDAIHDDLVLSVGIALWYAERIDKPISIAEPQQSSDWNPYDFL